MSPSGVPAPSSPSDALAVSTLAGPSPVMEGEDHRGYEELLHRVTAALQPMDIMEEMWIYDIVGLAWDTFRWRRVKAHELTRAAGRQIRELIKPFVVGDAQQVSEQWALGNEAAAERVNAALAAAGLSTRSVVIQETGPYGL